MTEARARLVEAGLLPPEFPRNYTFNKVLEVLSHFESASEPALDEAIAAAKRLHVRGPLAVVIFIKHHLSGPHDAEIDRLTETEEGTAYGVLVYPEGELPVSTDYLPATLQPGSRVRYEPSEGRYTAAK